MDYQILHLLFRCNKEFSHEKIRKHELSDTECRICSYIYSHENCSQEDVALALKTDKTTVGKALAALEKKNIVLRRKDTEDRRFKRLSLTEEGRGKLAELVDMHNNWLAEIMTCLSAEEQQQFESYCRRLLIAAEEMTPQSGSSI